MPTYSNGNIPGDVLVALRDQPAGARLLADAAASWERMSDECWLRFGWRPRVTSGADAYRPYAVQERIFRQRYVTYYTGIGPKLWDSNNNGTKETWWRLPVWATAAVPGTSNHGRAVACDITGLGGFNGTRYRQLASIAAKHGWDNNEGRSIAEAWHWVYKGSLDLVARTIIAGGSINIPVPGGSLPAPLEEEDIMASRAELQKDLEQSRNEVIAAVSAMFGGARTDRQADLQQTRNELLEALGRHRGERQADLEQTRNEIVQALSSVIQGAGDGPTTVYRLPGGSGLWQDVIVARRYLSPAMFTGISGAKIEDAPAADAFWELPILGRVGEVFRAGIETEAAWLLEGGALRWLDQKAYADAGSPVITDLSIDDPLWELPTVGALPPNLEGA